MASGSLVGQSDATEQQDKVYGSRKNQRQSQNLKSVPRKTLVNTNDENMPVKSDYSSSQLGAYNRCEPGHGNAISGYFNFNSFVKIKFDLSNRKEVRALKRKLASELDQVTSLVKRLETTQIQLNRVVNRNAATVSVNKSGNNLRDNESVEKEKMAPTTNQFYKDLDVVGSEKLGPEGNKKLKSDIKGNRFMSNKDLSRLFKSCHNILERLMKHKYGWVFNKPVDVKGLGLHDYYTIIEHPIDLGTVKARLSKNLYKSLTEFVEDVRLTFRNAMLYNPKGQDVHVMAEELSKIFEEMWIKIDKEYNFTRPPKVGPDSGFATPSPKTVPSHLVPVCTPAPPLPVPVCTPTPAHPAQVHAPTLPPPLLEMRTLERVVSVPEDVMTKATNLAHQDRTLDPKKPKAKDLEKRDMTYEEKQRLSLNLQELPSDKLDNVVQIIKKRNPVLSQQDDEIEVDIDSFDPETLWELDRFVSSHKESLSENKGKTEVVHQATADADHIIQDRNMEPLIAEALKETEAVVEKIVSTSSPVLEEKYGDNANESSSSSDSRSDSGYSGSSSSDS